MEDDLRSKMTFDGRRSSMEDNNEDNLKNKEDMHIAGRHTALDIFRFVVFFPSWTKKSFSHTKVLKYAVITADVAVYQAQISEEFY